MAKLTEQLEQANNKITDLESQLNSANEARLSAETERDEVLAKQEELSSNLEKSTSETEQAKADVSKANEQIASLEDDNKKLSSEVDKLKSEAKEVDELAQQKAEEIASRAGAPVTGQKSKETSGKIESSDRIDPISRIARSVKISGQG